MQLCSSHPKAVHKHLATLCIIFAECGSFQLLLPFLFIRYQEHHRDNPINVPFLVRLFIHGLIQLLRLQDLV
jgi:hypothetical protein